MHRYLKALVIVTASLAGPAAAQDTSMSFFITSVNPGKGANLGGLKGADAHCKKLAEAAGVKGKTWAAYLSTSKVDARDRIGKGPWYNAKGKKVTDSVKTLHSENNGLTKKTALNEKGNVVGGRGDKPNRHDILTGSDANGRLVGNACKNWTSGSSKGSAMVGHHDRTGGGAAPTSWGSAHGTRGCSLKKLRTSGGDGLFYCFAKN